MYHIIEIQSSNHKDETTGQWSVKPSIIVTPIPQFDDLMAAKAAFHQTLAYAYQSKVDIHTVALVDHMMQVIDCEPVLHGQEKDDAE